MKQITLGFCLLACIAAGCSSAGTEPGQLPTAVIDEMRSNPEFEAVERMLTSAGQRLVLEEGKLQYLDAGDEAASGHFEVTIPVVNRESNEPDRYAWITYEQPLDTPPIVSLMEREDELEAPGYQPQCYYDEETGLWQCNPGSGSTWCSTYSLSDTCYLAGVWEGAYCIDGTKLYAHQRMTRNYYKNGRSVTPKDKLYWCQPKAAQSNCNSTCNIVY